MLSDEEIRRIAKAEVDLHYDAHGLAKNQRYEQDVQRQADAFRYAVAIFRNAGYSILPNEPTPEMIGAWYRYKNGFRYPDEPPARDTSDYGAYRAMLAAAKGEK
jgi:hypothetical protein